MVSLKELATSLNDYEWIGPGKDINITGIQYNSMLCKPGSLFVCLKGKKSDGHRYVDDAMNRGAQAFLAEKNLDVGDQRVVLKVQDSREAFGKLAARFYGFPSSRLNVVGITGTNGKTTTSYMVHSIFRFMRIPTGILGTVGCRIGETNRSLTLTTPETLDIQKILNEMVLEGLTHVVMEVSSHGLDLHRVVGVQFNTAVFTNITDKEHLDYHKTFLNYLAAKRRLFEVINLSGGVCVYNRDDPSYEKLIVKGKTRKLFYGIKNSSDVMASKINTSISGTSFTLHTPLGTRKCHLKIPGYFNVYNALAAVTVGVSHGLELNSIIMGLERLEGVPGRFQKIDVGQPFSVVVDYAHTSDALQNLLSTAKQCKPRKLVTVFGCGGDRDPAKRPEMGKVASQLSDYVFITTDNCRSENPTDIMEDIENGMVSKNYTMITDREEAIRSALKMARDGDMVVVAGKGHETSQVFKDKTLHLDDREVCRRLLLELGYQDKI